MNGIDDIVLNRDVDDSDINPNIAIQDYVQTAETVEFVNLIDELLSNYSDENETAPPDRTSEYVEKVDGDVVTNYRAASMRSADHDHQGKGVCFQQGDDALRLELVFISASVVNTALPYQDAKVSHKKLMPPTFKLQEL